MPWRGLTVLLWAFLPTLGDAASADPCPSGWTSYSGFCYQVRGKTSRTANIWTSARYGCRSFQRPSRNSQPITFLVSIHSSGEQTFIRQLIQNTANITNVQSVFIGLSSRTSRGGYTWSDGSPVSYTHWKPGFVVGSGKQCVAMGTSGDGYWNDRNCDDASAYICKTKQANYVVPTQGPPTTANVYCESGWQQYGSRCYRYSSIRAIYQTALTSCTSSGADLLSIDSIYEQAYILSTLRGKGNIWLGLNDISTEGEYVWSDKTDVTYTDWGFGEPNSLGGEDDCVEMITSTGLWNDLGCKQTLNYICEKAANQANPPKPATSCQRGWVWYNNHCYWFNATAMLNFTLAESFCVSQKSHLVHINDIYEMAYITSHYPLAGGTPIVTNWTNHFWIGLNDMKTEGLYQWTDGYPVEITAWRQGEPNDYSRQEDCTEIIVAPSTRLVTGLWNDFYCSRPKGLICERRQENAPATSAPQPTQILPGTCSDGWIRFNNYCYKFDILLRLSWPQAQQRCQQYGANLISIHSLEEQNFVIKHASSPTSMWLGLNDRNLERGYVWSDGSPVQFTNWNRGEPNNYFGQEDCVENYLRRSSSNSKWNDQRCGQLRYFGCKIGIGKKVTTPTATIPPYYGDPCPNSTTPGVYTYSYGPYCYAFVEKTSAWSDAQKACRQKSHGGNLVSITSFGEQEFLANTIATINSSALYTSVWIGLHDKDKEGTFAWVDNAPIDFMYWNNGEPNNLASEDCVEFVKGMWWNDQSCTESMPYICKYPRPKYQIPTPYYPNASIWGYCPENWSSFGSYCYQLNKTAVAWPDAEKTCKSTGGHLTSILSATEGTFINKHLLQSINNAWIGLNDRDNEHTFVWSDGMPLLVVSWWRNQPNDFDGQQNCVYINRGQGRWNDLGCGRKFPFVCKRPKIPYPSTAPPSLPSVYMADCTTTYSKCQEDMRGYCQHVSCPNNCHSSVFGWQIYSAESSICTAAVQAGVISSTSTNPTITEVVKLGKRSFYSSANENGIISKSQGSSSMSFTFNFPSRSTCTPGWIPHNRSCYLFVENSNKVAQSWSQAQRACRTKNSRLLTIDDQLEQAFIQSQLPTDQGAWIGLNDIRRQGKYVWTNGVPLRFTVWASGQPNDQGHTQNCVQINANGGHGAGTWTTANCDQSAGYICEQLNEGLVSTAATAGAGACPSDWQLFGTSCYLATLPNCSDSDCFLSWSDALKSCKTKNSSAYLTSVDTYGELRLAQLVLPRLGWDRVWMGLNDIKNEGSYVWSDGRPLQGQTFKWAPGQPDDSNGTQNCVAMLQDGTISDEDCNLQLPYSCEMPVQTQPQPQPHTSSGLSSGSVAGIVVGVLLVFAVVIVMIVIFRRRRGRTGGGYDVAKLSGDDDDEGLLPGGDDKNDDEPLPP